MTITGYTGTDTEIVIPGNINGKRVTKIGASAFAFNTTLTSVTMQRGLFEIGFDAFQSCTSLAQVNLPDGLSFIDDYAFGNCTALETITLPSSVQRVSAKTFFGCTGMQEFAANGPWFFAMDGVLYERQNPVLVAYPAGREGHYTVVEGTQEIQDQAFGRAEKLTSLTIPDGVTKLYTSTFEDCSALEWIDLPATLTEIEDHTFAMCSSLKEIILPNDITIIGEEVFAPETVIYCQENTTTAQTLAAAGYSYQAIPFTYTDNGDGTATIMQYTGTAANVKVPAMIDGLRVTSIGGFVAIENETLESVILPEGIETIKHMAFASTRALKSISLPESLIEIQGSAFVDSTALESIFLPKNVQNVGRAFYNCPSQNAWFKAEDGVLFDKAGTTIIFYPGGKEGSYEVPYGVTTIAVESFACAEKLTSVVIPGTVEVIGELAFEGCLSLKDISLSEGLLYIDRGAFHYCSALESIYLPSTVEIAPEGVFLNCGRMTAYEVAEGNATLSAVDGVLFSKDGTTLYAFPGAKAGHYDVPAGVTTIHNNAFSKAEYLTSLSIPLNRLICLQPLRPFLPELSTPAQA